jgi:chemotaxis signal transduction protein
MPTASDRRAAGRHFDWAAAHARIERAIGALQASADPSPDDVRRILRERAERYARAQDRAAETAMMDVAVFLYGGLRFAIELSYGAAAATLANLTPVPGLPPFYLGVMSHRGSIYPVIQLRPFLSLNPQQEHELRYAVLIRDEGGMLGLAASEVLGISRFRRDAIALAPDEVKSNRIVLGIGPDSTTIIHAGHLLQDARLVVDHQPDMPTGTPGS